MDKNLTRYNTADAMLEALQEADVSFLFSNLGSDHPSVIEALAKARAEGRPLPDVVICPHEFVALSAAHGYYLLSGQAQGVFVHTDVGTQNLGGSLHNAERSQVPVFIFAGETPSTMNGELPGTRNSPINFIQNVYDQRGIVRPYVKWEYDIRTGKNVKQLVFRALQMANSDPKGPVYLTGAREILEEAVDPSSERTAPWKPVESPSLPAAGAERVVTALAHARNPLVITSYLGRNMESVEQLVRLCERLALPVIEATPTHMNFPGDHPLHMGFEGGKLLSNADVVLVIDTNVPWIPSLNRPGDQCTVFCIDIDPIKESIPLWHVPAEAFYRADSYESLLQMNKFADRMERDEAAIKERFQRYQRLHWELRHSWKEEEHPSRDGVITPEWLTTCLREVLDDETVVINETITNAPAVFRHLPRSRPGTMFANGGTSLGWHGGASIGAKLACPDKTVVCLTGDGSYLFSVPSSVHWMSRRYQAPFLTVIYNNQGWNATKNNYLKLYPDGVAKRDDRYWVNFNPVADLSQIAKAAGGACALSVSDPAKLQEVLQTGMDAVKNGRSAVIDVRLEPISHQQD